MEASELEVNIMIEKIRSLKFAKKLSPKEKRLLEFLSNYLEANVYDILDAMEE